MRHTLTLLTTTLALMLTAIAVTGGKPAPAQNQNDWTEPFPGGRPGRQRPFTFNDRIGLVSY